MSNSDGGRTDRDGFSPTPTQRRAARRRLLPWFRRIRRSLPWREDRHPYRVWLSEIMLQQTRAETVVGYFHRFLEAFPDVEALARAPLDDVLKLWEGLGYYARARNLHKAARLLAEDRGGMFPETAAEWKSLPGVGDYTAAAIASLACREPVAVLDGNVIRVVARLSGFSEDVERPANRRLLQAWAQAFLVREEPGDSNEAMMELGATICVPARPRCGQCPLASICVAYSNGDAEQLPVRKPKKAVPHKQVGAGVVIDSRGRVLIARRLEGAMLGGLWEFPGGGQEEGESMEQCIRRELQEELGILVAVGARLRTVRHAYSHFTIELHVHWARLKRGRPRPIGCSRCRWAAPKELDTFAFSRADQLVVEQLRTQSPAELRRVREQIG